MKPGQSDSEIDWARRYTVPPAPCQPLITEYRSPEPDDWSHIAPYSDAERRLAYGE